MTVRQRLPQMGGWQNFDSDEDFSPKIGGEKLYSGPFAVSLFNLILILKDLLQQTQCFREPAGR